MHFYPKGRAADLNTHSYLKFPSSVWLKMLNLALVGRQPNNFYPLVFILFLFLFLFLFHYLLCFYVFLFS